MHSAVIFAFAFACVYAFEDVHALPASTGFLTDDTISALAMKEVKKYKNLNNSHIPDVVAVSKALFTLLKALRMNDKVFDPVCIYDSEDSNFQEWSFPSQCIVDMFNCELGTKFAVKNKGMCPAFRVPQMQTTDRDDSLIIPAK